ANFACPGLVERHHRRKQERHPNQAAGDLARFLSAWIERKTEHDHHQQRKEQHGVDGVLRPPLEAQVFEQSDAGDAGGRAHLFCSRLNSRVRPTILPNSIQTNSSAAPSSNEAWCVTMNTVLP